MKLDNYCSIALSPTLSEVIELSHLAPRFSPTVTFSLDLRRASTTALCTGLLKTHFHVTCHVHHGTPVFGCFLDVPEAFHFASNDLLYQRMRV